MRLFKKIAIIKNAILPELKRIYANEKNKIEKDYVRKNIIVSPYFFVINSDLKPHIRLYGRGKLANSAVGEYTYIHSSVIAHTTIGRFCSIAPGNFIAQGEHPVNFLSTHPLFYSPNVDWQDKFSDKEIIKEHSRVIIGNDVWIGAGCYIKDGVKIGNGSIIASGSVVIKDVPDYAIVGGVPAKLIKYRFDNVTIQKLLDLKWWNKNIDTLKKCKEFFQQNINSEKITDFINCLQNNE